MTDLTSGAQPAALIIDPEPGTLGQIVAMLHPLGITHTGLGPDLALQWLGGPSPDRLGTVLGYAAIIINGAAANPSRSLGAPGAAIEFARELLGRNFSGTVVIHSDDPDLRARLSRAELYRVVICATSELQSELRRVLAPSA